METCLTLHLFTRSVEFHGGEKAKDEVFGSLVMTC